MARRQQDSVRSEMSGKFHDILAEIKYPEFLRQFLDTTVLPPTLCH